MKAVAESCEYICIEFDFLILNIILRLARLTIPILYLRSIDKKLLQQLADLCREVGGGGGRVAVRGENPLKKENL